MRAAALGATLALALALVGSAAAESTRVPRPRPNIERPGQCVADTDTMRRNHMEMLKHDRDRTARDGVRKVQASLKACVDCHASARTGSVNAAPDDFCAGCHRYAAVSLDCFECHSATRRSKVVLRALPESRVRISRHE